MNIAVIFYYDIVCVFNRNAAGICYSVSVGIFFDLNGLAKLSKSDCVVCAARICVIYVVYFAGVS